MNKTINKYYAEEIIEEAIRYVEESLEGDGDLTPSRALNGERALVPISHFSRLLPFDAEKFFKEFFGERCVSEGYYYNYIDLSKILPDSIIEKIRRNWIEDCINHLDDCGFSKAEIETEIQLLDSEDERDVLMKKLLS